jgi:hypothetical protein
MKKNIKASPRALVCNELAKKEKLYQDSDPRDCILVSSPIYTAAVMEATATTWNAKPMGISPTRWGDPCVMWGVGSPSLLRCECLALRLLHH